jgi:20S proteasome alpha/beta subunit
VTVLVGMLCREGVIVGADSSATFGAGNTRTIEQPTRKISIVKSRVIVATTGEVGLGQRFVDVVEKLYAEKKLRGSPLDVGKAICAAALKDFGETHPHLAPLLGNRQLPLGALVASAQNGRPYLIEFGTGTLQPELKDTIFAMSQWEAGRPSQIHS